MQRLHLTVWPRGWRRRERIRPFRRRILGRVLWRRFFVMEPAAALEISLLPPSLDVDAPAVPPPTARRQNETDTTSKAASGDSNTAAATNADVKPATEATSQGVSADARASAALKIQRSQRSSKSLFKFPSVAELKSLYIDSKALEAGAEGSKWYSSLALAAREHVRLSPEVQDACQAAWVGIMQAARHAAEQNAREQVARSGGTDDADAAASRELEKLREGLTRSAYGTFSRKLYLFGKLEENDDKLEAVQTMPVHPARACACVSVRKRVCANQPCTHARRRCAG